MDYNKILKEYIKLFILIVEAEGQKRGNRAYQSISKLFSINNPNFRSVIEHLEKEQPDFRLAISNLIICVIVNIHDLSDISGPQNSRYLGDLMDHFYTHYLRVGTNRFLNKNGLGVMEKPSDCGDFIYMCNDKNGVIV